MLCGKELSAPVARTLARIRALPILVAVVLAVCGLAIAAAFLISPHGTQPSVPFDIPPRQPAAAPAPPPPPPPQPRPFPPPVPPPPPVVATPLPPTDESSAIDWNTLPVQPQSDLLGELPNVGPLAVRRAAARIRRCLPPSPAGTPPPTLDVALGMTVEDGVYTIQHAEVLGSTVTDRAVETCVAQSLIGLRFAGRGGQDRKQLRIGTKITVPTLGGRQRSE